jgi:hypothetical protein
MERIAAGGKLIGRNDAAIATLWFSFEPFVDNICRCGSREARTVIKDSLSNGCPCYTHRNDIRSAQIPGNSGKRKIMKAQV